MNDDDISYAAAYGREWYLSDIPYEDLTHFYYSFIYLRKDGKIEVGDPDIDLSGMSGELACLLDCIGFPSNR